MSALFALIPTKDKLYGLAIIALIVLGLHYHHKVLAEGIAEQKAADVRAAATLEKQTAQQTAELQAKATMAEQAYDKEIQAIANQPPVQSVRLCLNTHSGSAVVPKAGAQVGGSQSAGATPVGIQQVPSRDSSSGEGQPGPDIAGLLNLLAGKADTVSAELREDQSRE